MPDNETFCGITFKIGRKLFPLATFKNKKPLGRFRQCPFRHFKGDKCIFQFFGRRLYYLWRVLYYFEEIFLSYLGERL